MYIKNIVTFCGISSGKTQEIDAMNQLMDWLPKHMPQNERVTVVHGDFRLVYIFISSLWYLDNKFQLSLDDGRQMMAIPHMTQWVR
jgi:hypothetical protein